MRRLRATILGLVLIAVSVGSATAGELVVNGGFESGEFGSSWAHGAFRKKKLDPGLGDHIVLPELTYTGQFSALLGFKYTGQGNATAFMYQDVAIPSNISGATLGFQSRMQGYDGDFYARFVMDIRDTNDNVLQNVSTFSFGEFDNKFKDGGWVADDDVPPLAVDVSGFAGQTVRLYFEQSNLNDNQLETWSYVDDVSLVFRKWIDLAVDGAGDDEFGAMGSGGGGMFARSAVAGDTLFYALRVENEGPVDDAYTLTASPPAGWTLLVDYGAGWQGFPFATATIPSGAALEFVVALVSPATETGGSYDVIVDGVSVVQGNRFDSATIRANLVDAVYATDMVVDGNGFGTTGDNGAGGFALKTTTWNAPLTYALELYNTGNQSTPFRVEPDAPDGVSATIVLNGNTYTGAFTTPSVVDGESLAMTLEVSIAAPEPGGDFPTIVTAKAVNDTLRRDSIRAIARLLEPRVDMVIGTAGDGVYDPTLNGLGGYSTIAAERGLTVGFPILLQNEAAIADSFALDWVPPAGGWSAVIEMDGVDRTFPVTTPTLAPFSQKSYVLKVTIRNGASYGTYRSFLNAVSRVDNRVAESVAASVSVASGSEIDMTIDGNGAALYGPIGTGLGGLSERTVAPGDTVVFQLDVLSIGGTDAHDLSWVAPSGWSVFLGGSPMPLSGVPAGTYPLTVVVPASALGGNYDVVVDGTKSDKPYLMDSVTGRVIVVAAAAVDAVIDGDGDDVFGAPGTGQGGSSLQTTLSPSTLNFTLEIRNQGASDDQYRVTWNAFAGWGATLSGGASPALTSTLAPGASQLLTFSVSVPASALTGDYRYVIDVESLGSPGTAESVEAIVRVLGPPRVDLAIDGNGAGVFGVMGSGQGGTSVRGANAGTQYVSTLRVTNAGSFADSFRVQWEPPTGWPAGSVVMNDGASDLGSPFWTPVLSGGEFIEYIVRVDVPPDANASHATIINSWSSLPPNLTESVTLLTETRALVRGQVFEDRDQDGVYGPGDAPIEGVRIDETATGGFVLSDATGAFEIRVPGGSTATVIERNPSGFVSLSPDTLGPFSLDAGDTVVVAFADLAPLYLSPGGVRQGLAGAFVDFPHTVEAGAPGQVTLNSVDDGGATVMFMLDVDGNGVFDGADRALTPADLLLDPGGGNGTVAILARVFVPAGVAPATTIHVDITAGQAPGGGPVLLTATASDAVVVVGDALGRLSLSKSADSPDAAPGDVITYTISFFNAGSDSLRNLVVLDPISAYVDLEADGFGPGQDVEWVLGGNPPVYLTYTDADGDECVYSDSERLLRLLFARNGPFFLEPGQSGTLSYRVRVR